MPDFTSIRAKRFTIALALTGAWAAVAQVPSWKELTLPSGGTVTALASVDGALWAGTENGGLYRNETGLGTWTLSLRPSASPAPATGILAMGSVLYAGFGSRVDLGIWDCFNPPPLCTDPGSFGGLYRSGDGGLTWEATPLKAVMALHAFQGTLYAATLNGIHSSSDGKVWKKLKIDPNLGIDRVAILALRQASSELVLTTRRALLRATLIGDSLASKGRTELPGGGGPTGLALLGADFLVSTASALYHTRPGRTSWDTLRTPGYDWMGEDSGAIFAYRDNAMGSGGERSATLFSGLARISGWDSVRVAGSGGGGIGAFCRHRGNLFGAEPLKAVSRLVAAEGGNRWAPAGQGLSAYPAFPLHVTSGTVWVMAQGLAHAPVGGGEWVRDSVPTALDGARLVSTPGSLWLGARSGLWRRDSAGGAWSLSAEGEVTALEAFGNRVVAALERGAAPSRGHTLAFCEEKGPCRETPAGMFGKTTVFPSPMTGQDIAFNRMSFVARSGDTVLAADSLLYRSRDGGNTWDTVAAPGVSYAGLAFSGGLLYRPASPGRCIPCLDRSADLGVSWVSLPYEGPARAFSRVKLIGAGTRLFLVTDQGLLMGDDGAHWTEIGKPGITPVTLVAGGGHAAVSDIDNRLWTAALPETQVGIRARPAPARRTAPAALRFVDRLGRPRLVNGALSAGPGRGGRR